MISKIHGTITDNGEYWMDDNSIHEAADVSTHDVGQWSTTKALTRVRKLTFDSSDEAYKR